MKLWLMGLALLTATSVVQAENYLVAQSLSQKLDVWIDDIKDNTAKSWCDDELSLRIVTHGNRDVAVLDDFMPRVGTLLEHQCARLRQVNWSLVDSRNRHIVQGTAEKSRRWGVEVFAKEAAGTTQPELLPPEENIEQISQVADRRPWQEFALLDGCRLRTFWQDNAGVPALFIPSVDSFYCEKGGWLRGRNIITLVSNELEKEITVTFVHGFPVTGLNESVDPDKLLITAVNNERMVVSTENAQQSWMILPYVPGQNSWEMTGTLVVRISREQANDAVLLQSRVDEARNIWSPWLAPDINLNVVLIDALYPLLRNPAASAWRITTKDPL